MRGRVITRGVLSVGSKGRTGLSWSRLDTGAGAGTGCGAGATSFIRFGVLESLSFPRGGEYRLVGIVARALFRCAVSILRATSFEPSFPYHSDVLAAASNARKGHQGRLKLHCVRTRGCKSHRRHLLHQWFSGEISRCQRGASGSIPRWCIF